MIHPRDAITPCGGLPHLLGTFITILLSLVLALPAQAQKTDETELRNLMNVYAEAANEADAKLGSQVWCGSEEDSVTNPGGHWQGPQQIKAFYTLLNDTYSERKLTFDTVSIHSYGDFAWTEFTGDFVAKQRKDGAPFSFHAAETQIYRKSDGKWCLVHVHYATFPSRQPDKGK